jgi:hypothetical protein
MNKIKLWISIFAHQLLLFLLVIFYLSPFFPLPFPLFSLFPLSPILSFNFSPSFPSPFSSGSLGPVFFSVEIEELFLT